MAEFPAPTRTAFAIGVFAFALAAATTALAWGSTGHRLIGIAAIQALPGGLPGFVRSPQAALDMGELAREPDRWRDAGKVHDTMRDPAHFVDVDDQGKVLGGPELKALPSTRTEYDTALRLAGTDSAKSGWLPYAIVDGWEELAKDFADWRADVAGLRLDKDAGHQAWLERDKTRREYLTLRDLGTLAHYVGDGSQPLHASVHYNGWGPGPNPEGFTLQRIHSSFEGPFVRDHVTLAAVKAAMSPPADCHCAVLARIQDYLARTNTQVAPLYRLEKAGAFQNASQQGVSFATMQVAAGASELRDLIVSAWNTSGSETVGHPATPVGQIEAGQAAAYPLLYGDD